MKINILYSHYNVTGCGNKFRPIWFDYEKCFINLLNTIKGKDINLHIIMDGKIEDNWINKYSDKFTLHEIQGGTMEKAAMAMYDIALNLSKNMDKDDLFYFLENDYIHTEDWYDKIIELFSSFKELNYVSLYDHNDKYFLPQYEDLVSKIVTTNSHHWRTTPSTCGSYIVSKGIFEDDYNIITTIIGDHNKWVYLNENKERFILSPIPGLSTHCMEGLLSPTINWEQINNL